MRGRRPSAPCWPRAPGASDRGRGRLRPRTRAPSTATGPTVVHSRRIHPPPVAAALYLRLWEDGVSGTVPRSCAWSALFVVLPDRALRPDRDVVPTPRPAGAPLLPSIRPACAVTLAGGPAGPRPAPFRTDVVRAARPQEVPCAATR
ncbi:hypothetical protein FTX61_07960 [Nitriliruptoraceae bacterium ZYF776]|nr:hypothetical protein [Profundirhabdus halotolerans]